MAVLTNDELAKLTHKLVKDIKTKDGISNIPYSRPKVWAAFQDIRDILDGAAFRNAVNSAIDTAIAPETMTVAQKKRMFGRVIELLFSGEIS